MGGTEKKYPREFLLEICKEFKQYLDSGAIPRPYDSIEIAGSLRRQEKECGDIELVIKPKMYYEEDMFKFKTAHSLFEGFDLTGFGKLEKNGEKYKKLMHKTPSGLIQLDLFIVMEPANYGVIFAIRTGPADFIKRVVTSTAFKGHMPADHCVKDGSLWRKGEIVPCYTERDFFNAIGMEYIKPEDRK